MNLGIQGCSQLCFLWDLTKMMVLKWFYHKKTSPQGIHLLSSPEASHCQSEEFTTKWYIQRVYHRSWGDNAGEMLNKCVRNKLKIIMWTFSSSWKQWFYGAIPIKLNRFYSVTWVKIEVSNKWWIICYLTTVGVQIIRFLVTRVAYRWLTFAKTSVVSSPHVSALSIVLLYLSWRFGWSTLRTLMWAIKNCLTIWPLTQT